MNIKAFCPKAARAAALMKNLANPHRLVILCRLHAGECSVSELEDLVCLTQSALSQHLARLRRDKVVATRRDAQTIYYRLTDPKTAKIIKQLYTLYC
ncbi:MAG: metalloregulator ArsR/SmtB family transcription factor [Alphaproteobacteria bacterium]|nr:metalloregulator ArsR/SmtB family transcription factor [Alphaproteobacteria bacterium]